MQQETYTIQQPIGSEKDDVSYVVSVTENMPEMLWADVDTKGDTSKVSVGDIVVIFDQGWYRTAVVNKVGRKNIKAGYTTMKRISDAVKKNDYEYRYSGEYGAPLVLVQHGGNKHPKVTNKSTDQFWAIGDKSVLWEKWSEEFTN